VFNLEKIDKAELETTPQVQVTSRTKEYQQLLLKTRLAQK
jgi:hypothetical protein